MVRQQRHARVRRAFLASMITTFSALWLAFPAAGSTPPAVQHAPAKPQPGGDEKAISTVANWLFESNNAFANAGAAAVTLGDVNGDGISDFAVGAPNYDGPEPGQLNGGAVFVFFGRQGGPNTTPDQSFYSTLGSFGAAVAPAGDVNGDGYHDLLVGVPDAADGRVHVYLGSPTGLQASPAWQYAHNDPGFALARFGSSVAPAGDVNGDGYDDIIIGADFSGDGAGAAFVFLGGVGGLSPAVNWSLSGGAGHRFGISVSGAGDVNGDGYDDVIIGATGAGGSTPQGDPYYGVAYVYHGGPAGLASFPTTRLFGLQFGAAHGRAVAGAGDVNGDGYADVVVGSPLWDSPSGSTDTGRAQIFPGSAGGVSTTPIFEERGNAAFAQFGAAVAPAGDVNGDGLADVVVGVPSRIDGLPNNGYAAVVRGARAGVGTPSIYWFVPRGNAAGFGAVVGTAGDVNNDGFSDLIVGSPLYANGQTEEGAAEIFYGGGDPPFSSLFNGSVNGWHNSTFLGWVTTTVGDVDGDGFSDVAVSAPNLNVNMAADGGVLLYNGSASGLSATRLWAGEQSGGSFGYAVAAAGDVNGDGYGDVIVGAPLTGSSGKAYVWHGGPFGPSSGPADWSASFGTAGAWFGASVAGAGDVNGDGYADVIIGAPNDENDQTDEGRAYLFLGSAAGLAAAPAWVVEGDQAGARLGISVASAGDVNRDGYSDVIVGADMWDIALSPPFSLPDAGLVLVYHGGAGGPATAPALTIGGAASLYQFGSCVAPAGDIDGDGYSDVIVAARYADVTTTDEGEVYVFRGSPSGLSSTAHWSHRSGQAFANLGSWVAGAGDVNGDGYSDVIVGALFADRNGYQDNGQALVFAGPLTGAAATTPLWSFAGQQSFENLGNAVGAAGDINGDGFADILTGSPGYTANFFGEGRMLVFYGNRLFNVENTRSWQARQRRGDDSAPLALLGRTGTPPALRLKALGASAAGRSRVRLEWEVKPLGLLFDGQLSGRGTWADNGLGGAGNPPTLDSGNLTLPAAATAHWRLRVASRSPYHPHSPWISPAGNGPQEADVRVGNPALTSVGGPGLPLGAPLAVSAAPNPFNPRTSLLFALPREGRVKVELFDLRGRLLATLLDEVRPAGRVELAWDGRDGEGRPLSSGAYHARVTAAGQVGSARLLLVR